MKRLHPLLSLGLASALTLVLLCPGAAAAAFSDQDQIVHPDAVTAVADLGLFAGLPDGSFAPAQNIDRASFARLVTLMLNGGKIPTLENAAASFPDTEGHWAKDCITYCASLGIISGRSETVFAPDDPVTIAEGARMLLSALGYRADYEGISGATWRITVDILADQAGLYADMGSFDSSTPLTRDMAAQMVYNALNIPLVTYEETTGSDGVKRCTRVEQKDTLLTSVFAQAESESYGRAAAPSLRAPPFCTPVTKPLYRALYG